LGRLRISFTTLVIFFIISICFGGPSAPPSDRDRSSNGHYSKLNIEIIPEKLYVYKNNTLEISYILRNVEDINKYKIKNLAVNTKLPEGFDPIDKDLYIAEDSKDYLSNKNKFSYHCNSSFKCSFNIYRNNSLTLRAEKLDRLSPAIFNCSLHMPSSQQKNRSEIPEIYPYQISYDFRSEKYIDIKPKHPIPIDIMNNKPNIKNFSVKPLTKKYIAKNNTLFLLNNTPLIFEYNIKYADDFDRLKLIIKDNQEILPDNVTKNHIAYKIHMPPINHIFTLEARDLNNETDLEINGTLFAIIKDPPRGGNIESLFVLIKLLLLLTFICIIIYYKDLFSKHKQIIDYKNFGKNEINLFLGLSCTALLSALASYKDLFLLISFAIICLMLLAISIIIYKKGKR
jgi:hypothetical protein